MENRQIYETLVAALMVTKPPLTFRPDHKAVVQWRKDVIATAEAFGKLAGFTTISIVHACGFNLLEPGDPVAITKHKGIVKYDVRRNRYPGDGKD